MDGELRARVNGIEQTNQQRDANISTMMMRDEQMRREASDARAREESLRQQIMELESQVRQGMMGSMDQGNTQPRLQQLERNMSDLMQEREMLRERVASLEDELGGAPPGQAPGQYSQLYGPERGAGRGFSPPPYGPEPGYDARRPSSPGPGYGRQPMRSTWDEGRSPGMQYGAQPGYGPQEPMGPDAYGMNQPMQGAGPYPPMDWRGGPGMGSPRMGSPRMGLGTTPQQMRRASQDRWRQKQWEEAPANAAWAQNKNGAPRGTHFLPGR